MERIKSFDVRSEPTGKGVKKDLSALVDETINGWLDANPEIDNIRISHAARPDAAYPSAFVIVTYEVGPSKVEGEEVPQNPPDVELPEPEAQRRRGRPPKDK